MALLAESLVEEWLNRNQYFTIRGVKTGVDEIDILGINVKSGKAIHLESQVSFRPVGYISPLPKSFAKELGRSPTSAWERPEDILEKSVESWIQKKYHSKKKIAARNHFAPKQDWSLILVHGIVREEKELEFIKAKGIRLIPFYNILQTICTASENEPFKAHSGTDIAEMIEFYSFKTLYSPNANIFI